MHAALKYKEKHQSRSAVKLQVYRASAELIILAIENEHYSCSDICDTNTRDAYQSRSA